MLASAVSSTQTLSQDPDASLLRMMRACEPQPSTQYVSDMADDESPPEAAVEDQKGASPGAEEAGDAAGDAKEKGDDNVASDKGDDDDGGDGKVGGESNEGPESGKEGKGDGEAGADGGDDAKAAAAGGEGGEKRKRKKKKRDSSDDDDDEDDKASRKKQKKKKEKSEKLTALARGEKLGEASFPRILLAGALLLPAARHSCAAHVTWAHLFPCGERSRGEQLVVEPDSLSPPVSFLPKQTRRRARRRKRRRRATRPRRRHVALPLSQKRLSPRAPHPSTATGTTL